MSAAELFRWPIAKWTHPCGNFIASTKGSPRFCATCSFTRHVHAQATKEVSVSERVEVRWYAETADRHASADWRAGHRWSCACEPCSVARSEWYEPRGSNFVLPPSGAAR